MLCLVFEQPQPPDRIAVDIITATGIENLFDLPIAAFIHRPVGQTIAFKQQSHFSGPPTGGHGKQDLPAKLGHGGQKAVDPHILGKPLHTIGGIQQNRRGIGRRVIQKIIRFLTKITGIQNPTANFKMQPHPAKRMAGAPGGDGHAIDLYFPNRRQGDDIGSLWQGTRSDVGAVNRQASGDNFIGRPDMVDMIMGNENSVNFVQPRRVKPLIAFRADAAIKQPAPVKKFKPQAGRAFFTQPRKNTHPG